MILLQKSEGFSAKPVKLIPNYDEYVTFSKTAGFTHKENSGTANVRGLANKSKAESKVEEKRAYLFVPRKPRIST